MIGPPAYIAKLDQQNNKVLMHYRRLQANFADVFGEVRDGASSNEDIANKLAEMQEDMRGMGEYLSFQLPPKYYNQIKKEDSTFASQVFNIPELAELILSFMDTLDIMAMEQVNKLLRSIVNESSKVQIAACLEPSDEESKHLFGHRRSPFAPFGFPGLSIMSGKQIDATFTRIKTESGLPKVGPRWMKLLICQPPVKAVTVSRSCAVCGRCEYRSDTTITSSTGLTLRDLYEKAKEVFAASAPCQRCVDPFQLHNTTPAPSTISQSVNFYGSA